MPKIKYIAGFIVVCWIGIGIVYLLRNHVAVAVIALLVLVYMLVYSGLFGVLVWQQHKWKCDRQKWRSEREGKEGWAGLQKHAPNQMEESEEAETGWN